MLKDLMIEWNLDEHGVIEKMNNDLCNKYRSIINRFDMSGDKLYNFFRKNNSAYKQVTNEYLSWNF